MKKTILMIALIVSAFSVNGNAQQKEPKQKKKPKTEKSCAMEEKKSCDKDQKASCCASKKAKS